MGDLMAWVSSELASLVQFPVTEDIAKSILMIESNRELEEYLKSFLDPTNSSHQKFIKELLRRKQIRTQGYKKAELDNYIQSKPQEKKKKGGKSGRDNREVKKNEPEAQSHNTPNPAKKKSKFVNILSPDFKEGALLKGRHICNCQASKHKLINNCLKCGRVVCEQEGSGPCFFCNNPVYSRDEEKLMRSNPKAAQKNQAAAAMNTSLESAIQLRDRLLEYDKSSEKRTHVIDDESDYFTTNSVWLSKEQREEFNTKIEQLQALKNSRGDKRLLLDFTGRYVVEDTAKLQSFAQEDNILREITDMFSKSGLNARSNVDPKMDLELEPVYGSMSAPVVGSKWHNHIGKVQDKQVMEMTDYGLCLSMHQPWASLLICGIKEHEGRSWYTSHRGRLWIAAGSKVPTQEEIDLVQNQYRLIKGEDIKFPARYPTSVLLGCVNLVDCLEQEMYREQYANGESDSPFVFICENPVKCPVMFPIQGKHKIYKLDQKLHLAASKCIQRLAKES